MSKGIYSTYGSRAISPDSNYPEGIFKDLTSPGMNNGTPLQRDWAINIEAMFQKIRAEGHVTNSENQETVPACQTWAGLMRRLGNAPPHATPDALCAQFPSDDWADPSAAPNFLDTSDVIRDSCVGYISASSKHFLWVLHDDNSIHTVSGWGDYSASPVLSGALSFTWATTPDEVVAICSGVNYLYVAWYETGGTVYISRFDQNNWTGIEDQVWSTGITPNNEWSVALCNVSSSVIGFSIDTAASGVYLGGIQKTGPGVASDNFSGYNISGVGHKLVSDGTYMYIIGDDKSSHPTHTFAILRATILSPSTQAIYSIVVADTGTQYEYVPISIQRVRDMIIVSDIQGRVYALISGTVSTLFQALPHTWYDATETYGISMGTDGKTIYSLMCEDDEYGSYGLYSVFKMPIDQFHSAARSSSPAALDQRRARIATGNPLVLFNSSLLYDGIDMWLVLYTGEIYRICDTR